MALSVNTDALLKSTKRRAFMPSTGYALTDSDFTDILNEAVSSWLIPLLIKWDPTFFLQPFDIPLVAGQRDYVIPSRAAGSRFHSVIQLDSSGNPVGDALDMLKLYDSVPIESSSNTSGAPDSYAVHGNSLRLYPLPSAPLNGPTLRIWVPVRPSVLVATANAPAVTALNQVNGTTFTVTISGTPPGTFLQGASFDLVRSVSAFEVDRLGACTNLTGSVFTFSGTLPVTAAVGDYLCLQDTAPVVTWAPQEVAWALCQQAAVNALGSRGDDAKLQRAADGLAAEVASLKDLLLPSRDREGRQSVVSGLNRFGNFWPPYLVP